ncbi:MAG: 16S rRNA (guanine(527)-N(7))-methyltransferase RsmG [Paenibacillaceae bacterium]|nr:16S rRNA (guanine(527)-N(7))-methyltransferase RsmG [Paenibacillaceae bacterium]
MLEVCALPSESQFAAALACIGVKINEEQCAQLRTYADMLISVSQHTNLTAITDRDAVYEKHFYDSATVCTAVSMDRCTEMLDIGAGAGFPALVLRTLWPHLGVTVVEARRKRVRFMQDVCNALGFSDVRIIHGRAEHVVRVEAQKRYGLVVARAVASTAQLAQWSLPFARSGGDVVAMKGPEDDWTDATPIIHRYGGAIADVITTQLPWSGARRTLVRMTKVRDRVSRET